MEKFIFVLLGLLAIYLLFASKYKSITKQKLGSETLSKKEQVHNLDSTNRSPDSTYPHTESTYRRTSSGHSTKSHATDDDDDEEVIVNGPPFF